LLRGGKEPTRFIPALDLLHKLRDTGEICLAISRNTEDRWGLFDSIQSDHHLPTSTLPVNRAGVILHAPKNGFFYGSRCKRPVNYIFRATLCDVNWASGLDPKTGYPQIQSRTRVMNRPASPFISLAGAGAPIAGNDVVQPEKPGTGLYSGCREAALPYAAAKDWKTQGGHRFPDRNRTAPRCHAGRQRPFRREAWGAERPGSLTALGPGLRKRPVLESEYPGRGMAVRSPPQGKSRVSGHGAGELFNAVTADKGQETLGSFPVSKRRDCNAPML